MRHLQLPLFSLLLLSAGCGAGYSKAAGVPVAPDDTLRGTLAIEHRISVDLADEDVGKAHEAVRLACIGDAASGCTVLVSSVNKGEYDSGNLRVRIQPAGVEPLIALADSFGEITHRATEATDLAKPIADTGMRLAMLEAYLQDLTRLRQQSRQDVDALIRVAAEIAKTQSELDAANAEQAQLSQRVDLQILEMDFVSERRLSFWAPIGESLTNFRQDLGYGIARAIEGVAYLLPWLVVLIPLLFLIRRLWRKYK